jgi:hypothetical protein
MLFLCIPNPPPTPLYIPFRVAMEEIPRRRITVTSSLNEKFKGQLVNGWEEPLPLSAAGFLADI